MRQGSRSGQAEGRRAVHGVRSRGEPRDRAELKEHHLGESHAEATGLIKKVKPGGATLAKHLATLLAMKTNASYGSTPMKDNDVVRAERAADHLVESARERVTS